MTELKESSAQTLLARIRDGENLSLAERFALVAYLAVPAVLAEFSTILMHYIDAAMVGHYGAHAAAAIGLVSTTIWLFWGTTSMFLSGFVVQVAHRIGAKEFDKARSVMLQGIAVVTLAASVMALIGVLIHTRLPYWLGADADIAPLSSSYFLLVAGAFPLSVLVRFASGLLHSSGDIKTPSAINVGICVLDVVFNFFLIFESRSVMLAGIPLWIPGAGLGVAGAAIGTILSELAGLVLLAYALLARSPILSVRGRFTGLKFSRDTLRRALTIGAPIGTGRIFMTAAQVASTMIIAPLGTVSLAAHTLAITAESLCYMPGYGIAEAAATLSGQTLGARRPELARQLAWLNVGVGCAVMATMGVVMFFGAHLIMATLSSDPAVQALGATCLKIEAFAEPLYAAAIIANGVFTGAGDTFKPVLMNLFSFWGVRITAAYLLAPVYGLVGVWSAMCAELCLRGAMFLARLKFGSWAESKVLRS
jgi:putative MATE family efflux protein